MKLPWSTAHLGPSMVMVSKRSGRTVSPSACRSRSVMGMSPLPMSADSPLRTPRDQLYRDYRSHIDLHVCLDAAREQAVAADLGVDVDLADNRIVVDPMGPTEGDC